MKEQAQILMQRISQLENELRLSRSAPRSLESQMVIQEESRKVTKSKDSLMFSEDVIDAATKRLEVALRAQQLSTTDTITCLSVDLGSGMVATITGLPQAQDQQPDDRDAHCHGGKTIAAHDASTRGSEQPMADDGLIQRAAAHEGDSKGIAVHDDEDEEIASATDEESICGVEAIEGTVESVLGEVLKTEFGAKKVVSTTVATTPDSEAQAVQASLGLEKQIAALADDLSSEVDAPSECEAEATAAALINDAFMSVDAPKQANSVAEKTRQNPSETADPSLGWEREDI
eukprot:gnl/MRDRNA2_/MRDRNA2_146857_c0_seq1.p1 gnl/MRDRNA2_/MRDRNA2_146857_c0~~gnl/MRDRNA2_/MRDRNA2_146857_c0_seq1.p1  ORF type:complete len:302 (+),score=65.71 gnl/MRDRNA2_/MRDRNA2_146857_c0_seq1:40-906(+)